jgi:hypothetical protein
MLAVGCKLNALDGSNPHGIGQGVPFDPFSMSRTALRIDLSFH